MAKDNYKRWCSRNREKRLRQQKTIRESRNLGVTIGEEAREILRGMSAEQRLLALCRVCEEINRRKEMNDGNARKSNG